MAGDNPNRGKDHAPPSSKKHRWDNSSSSSKPSPKPGPITPNPIRTPNKLAPIKPNPNSNASPVHSGPQHHPHPHNPFLFHSPAPPPTYGFQMLDRRTIVFADGSVRSYFALPPDYRDTPLMFGTLGPMKRKFGEDVDMNRERERQRQKQQVLQYGGNVGSGFGASCPFMRREELEVVRPGKVMKLGGSGVGSNLGGKVDPAVIKAFLHFVKTIYENDDVKRSLLDDGKHGSLQCFACSGSSKDFPDVHSLVMHAYNSDSASSRVDHLGFHRALCALKGWNCTRAPDNSRMYQFLPADEAAAFRDDLIMWPPTVIVHNTSTGKGKDGCLEGLGNKAIDGKLRDLGFSGGKSRALYNRDGHLGISLVKFAGDQLGLKEAMSLSEHFEKDRHGRRDWALLQSIGAARDDEKNPNLVTVDERTGERKRVLYGYLLTASDLDKVDNETRKRVAIESRLEKLHASK